MTRDAHVHTFHSGLSTIRPLQHVARAKPPLHLVKEERFSDHLLFDLVARPAPALARVPELAA